jgi:hypothetical protein
MYTWPLAIGWSLLIHGRLLLLPQRQRTRSRRATPRTLRAFAPRVGLGRTVIRRRRMYVNTYGIWRIAQIWAVSVRCPCIIQHTFICTAYAYHFLGDTEESLKIRHTYTYFIVFYGIFSWFEAKNDPVEVFDEGSHAFVEYFGAFSALYLSSLHSDIFDAKLSKTIWMFLSL